MSASSLRLCLDTAEIAQWKKWASMGLFYGVTTNPLLLERSQVPCTVPRLAQLAEKALHLGFQEIQLQTWGETVEAMASTGKILAALAPQVVVKVPITAMGTEAAARLIGAGVRVTLTGVYAVPQVLIAAALGAEYTAPYLGRITDLGRNGREDLTQMQRVLEGVHSPTRILAASIRSVEDLAYLGAAGLNTFTFSAAIATQLFEVSATNAAAVDFERAAQAMAG